jgi:ABC-type sugar transport system ATPase subunit
LCTSGTPADLELAERVRVLRKSHPGVAALCGIDFDIHCGEILALHPESPANPSRGCKSPS